MSGSWARGAILAAAPRQGDKDAQDPRPQRWAGRIQGDSTRHRGQADDRRKWGSGHSNHGGGYVDASDVVAKNNAAAESVLGFTPRRYPVVKAESVVPAAMAVSMAAAMPAIPTAPAGTFDASLHIAVRPRRADLRTRRRWSGCCDCYADRHRQRAQPDCRDLLQFRTHLSRLRVLLAVYELKTPVCK